MTEPNQTAMVHLYRGELGRLTMYRVRLDTTTNWALGTLVGVVTFTLGQPSAPHEVLALPYVLGCVFAGLEARRYQEMELARLRVELLETGMFAPMLGAAPRPDWHTELASSLAAPRAPLTVWRALTIRARRNYVWLFLALYGAWWGKLSLSGRPLLEAAGAPGLPGQVVIGIATALVVPWVVGSLMAPRWRLRVREQHAPPDE